MRKLISLIVLIACGATGSALASNVTSIALSYQDGATMATINVDGPIRFTHEAVEAKEGKPFRVVVDILSSTHHLSAREYLSLPTCAVKGVRTSQYSVKPEAVVRLVFDLNKETVYRADSDTKAIHLYFMDKGVSKFADWSSAGAVTPLKNEPKAAERAETVVSSKTTVPVKSTEALNKSIENDRLASLDGKASPTAKPAVPDKVEPVKPEATKPEPAKVEVKTVPAVKPQPTSPDTKSTGVTKVESKAVEPQRPPSVIQAEPVKPAKKSATYASDEDIPQSLQGGLFSSMKPATAPKTQVTPPVPVAPVTVAQKPVEPAAQKPADKTVAVKATPTASAPTAVSSEKAVPASVPSPEVASKPAQTAETKVPANAAKPTVVSAPAPAESGAPDRKEPAKEPLVTTPASRAVSQFVAQPTGGRPGEAAASKDSLEPKDVDSEPALQKGELPVDLTGEVDPSKMVDADNEASADTKSTARFRRSPTGPTKLKGTLVAEFPGRLVIKYKSDALRDPFETLINDARTYNDIMQKRIPDVEGLRLVGILEGGDGENRALFEDKDDYGYILSSGDKVQKGYVLRVESDRVYFQIFEYGWSRTVALNIEEE
jgi:hypothetical protein